MAASGRVPVHDDHVERAVLASMYLRTEACHQAATRLTMQHFYRPKHQRLFRALCDLYEDGSPTDDLVLIHQRLARPDDDPWSWLVDVFDHVPTGHQISRYCDLAEELYRRRMMAQVAEEAAQLYRDGAVEEADSMLAKLIDQPNARHVVPPHSRQVDDLVTELESERAGSLPGTTTGFQMLDRLTGGFRKGCTYIVAGLPSMGKTAFTLQIVLAAARSGLHVHYWSIEMTATLCLRRMATFIAGLSLKWHQVKKFSLDEEDRVQAAIRELRSLPITIDARTSTIDGMTRQARQKRGKVGLFVVDHARLVEDARTPDETKRLTRVSKECKRAIAQRGDAAVLLLSQFNRSSARDKSQGRISDLFGSSALEQDADFILMLRRTAYQSDSQNPKAAADVAKNRVTGDCGTVPLLWDSVLGKFYEPPQEIAK